MTRTWRIAIPLFVGVAALVAWEIVVRALRVPEYLLPSPGAVWAAFADRARSLISDTGITALEAVAGFGAATLFASGAAVLFAHSRTAYASLMPYLIGLKAVPIIAVAPLLVIWFGNGFLGKAVMAMVICFFPIVVNLTRGLRDVPDEQLDLMRTLSATPGQIFFTVRVPNSLPYLFASLKIASTLSVVGAIVAEFSGASSGIGYVILVAALRIDTPLLFSGIILASLLGVGLYYVLEFLERTALVWRGNDG